MSVAMIPLLSRSLTRSIRALFLAFAFVAIAHAADIPKFSDPDVTAFAKDYSAYTDESIVAAKEASAGKVDTAKMQALMAKAEGMMNRQMAVEAKLKPDDKVKYDKFMTECMQRMTDASK